MILMSGGAIIHSEPTNALFEPKVHIGMNRGANLGVLPVQIWLTDSEQMKIVFI